MFKLEFLQITLLPNQNWGRSQGLRRGDKQEGQGARGGGADLAGDDEHRGNRRRRCDGSRPRGSRRRRGGTVAVGAEPHRPGRRGAGHGSPAGRRIARSERSAQGRRKAGPRDRGCGRSITSWGREKTFKEEPGGEKTGRRWLGAVSGRDRGWVRVWNSLFHTQVPNNPSIYI